jgi:light-regulated signal transduction histidine kinase (bacteriophytochrome)
MLSQIQERDQALGKIREGLEETVKSRTGELEREVAVRKQAEEQLKLYAAELVRSNNALRDFASIASHDLQEPLRKIIAFGDRLRSTCALGEQGENYLNRMQRATHRMQSFIHDLLEYSKVSAKPRQLQIVNLRDIVLEAVSDLENRITQTQGSVEVGELPTIEADRLQMRQLFQNMIGNALKFHKPGVPPCVRVEGRLAEPGQWEIAVRDNGIGFDMKYMDRIMKPFQRLAGRTEYEGSGMGLAICQKIADNHMGKIKADSVPDGGTCFTMLFPEKQRQER